MGPLDPGSEVAALRRRRRKRRVPMELAIASLVVALILAIFALVGIEGYRGVSLVLTSVSGDAASNLGTLANQRAQLLMTPANIELQMLGLDPLSKTATLDQRMESLPIVAAALTTNPVVEAFYEGYPDGGFVLFRPLRNDAARASFNAPADAGWLVESQTPGQGDVPGTWRYYDKNLKLLSSNPRADYKYDPRTRGWYQEVQAKKRRILTDPYVFFTDREIGVTIAEPSADGRAILGMDVSVNDLSTQMGALKLTPGTQLAVITSDQTVIAYADKGRSVVTEKNGDVRAAKLLDLGQPSLSELFAHQGDFGVAEQFDAGGRSWLGLAMPLQAMDSATVLIAAPTDELFGSARGIASSIALRTLVLCLLLLPVGLIITRNMLLPLRRLAEQVHAIAGFNFDIKIDVASRIREVDELAVVIQGMQSTIRNFLDVNAVMNHEPETDKMLAAVLAKLVDATGAASGAIYLHEDTTGALKIAGAPVNRREDGTHYPMQVAVDVLAEDPADLDPVTMALAAPHEELEPGEGDSLLLSVPLMDRDGDLIGVLLLSIASEDWRSGRDLGPLRRFVHQLSPSAAVAIETRHLLQVQKALLDSLILLVAGAIDAKSPYTGGHCQRVPELTLALGRAAHESTEGPFADFRFSDKEWDALRVGAWLHDCGKVTTPEYVVDKATKLETIYNRIHEVRTRFEVLKRDAEIASLKSIAAGADPASAQARLEAEWLALDDDFAFVAQCNVGSEYMAPAKAERLRAIAARPWTRTLDDRLGLSRAEETQVAGTDPVPLPAQEFLLADKPEHLYIRDPDEVIPADNPWGFKLNTPKYKFNRGEIYNLSIVRGTLTNEDRYIINDHIVQTIIMLSSLPWPRHLRAVPEIAGGHHERMDGKGYPKKLERQDMSAMACMMAIADVFEALTASDRPYKPPKTLSEALAIMKKMVEEQHLDSDLFDLFISAGVCDAYARQFLQPFQLDIERVTAAAE